MSTKRVQTDEIHAYNVASNNPATLSHAIAPDVTAALRNVGMRTRKSVLEGYAMNPNPQYGTPASRIKAMSTGTLFQSPRDAMQDARGHQLNSLITPRKRHRSASPIDNGAVDVTYNEEVSMSIDMGRQPERPVKPLKKTARSMLQSKSLPAGALFPGQSQSILQGDLRETDEEENDWSSDLTFQASASSITFEPTLTP